MDIRIKRNTFALLLASAAMLLLTACGHHKKEAVEGQTFRQTYNVAADGGQQTVTLTSLVTSISNIEQGDTWVVATKMSYTSGSPSIRLDIEENTEMQVRQTNITITDNSANKVILTVKQVKPGETPEPNPEPEQEKTGIDYPHNTESDQPAYSRQQL